ncbi:MAG: histidinol-phosphate transaminase [Nocardioidaceae bacterium]
MSTPLFRKALETIPAYKPGKPPTPGAAASYKLSSNENPYPPLPGVIDQAVGALATMNRYPDMGVAELHAALAKKYAVSIDEVASGAGSVAVFYHLLQASCEAGDEVVYAWRSFEAYPIAVGLTGARSLTVPVDAEARHDLPAMLTAITERTKAVVVCTPNNPTGPAVHRDELVEFLDAVPKSLLVVLDEAYREFVTDPDAADGLAVAEGRDNVVVLRTFSKAYGMAGLRVGFAIGPAEITAAIRKCALPFGVSTVAQAAAVASLEAEDELLRRVTAVVAERERVTAALTRQGWDVPDAQGNFVWLGLGDDAAAFAGACDAAGVAVRPFQGDGVRITVGEPEANDLLLGVSQQWRTLRGPSHEVIKTDLQ